LPESSTQTEQQKPKYWALVPAAGLGRRLGAKTPKQYLKLHGKEVLSWTLQTLTALDFLEKIVLVLHPEDNYFATYMAQEFPDVLLVMGGDERQDSVANGLEFLAGLADSNDWVLVHDAARPCLLAKDVNKLISCLKEDKVGGILATQVKDTLKRSDESLTVVKTLKRNEHWLAATPQLFRFNILLDALTRAKKSGFTATDEAAAVEAIGLPVKIVEGRSDNLKITSQEDLALAEFLLKQLGKVNA
jgi:2-C-methyl-D-erythritol 4-phosphate cytidylyltransferase